MLKQPVSVVNYTNVAIVRLKIGKKRLEIACYKNKVQQYRQKVENDINDVLQIQKIFKNAIKGDSVSEEELKTMFPNMSYEEVVKLILDKGEIQVSEKERNLNFQNLKNDIANIIVEKTYNFENGLPFTHNVIVKVLNDINFNLKECEDAKKQALKAIKLIQEKGILPIERKMMQIFITIKNQKTFSENFEEFKKKILEFLNSTQSEILDMNLDSPKQFKIKSNILPNHYRQFLSNYEEVLSIEIISNSQISKKRKTSDSQSQPQKFDYSKYKEEIVDTNPNGNNLNENFSNLKISNMSIYNMLNDDQEDKNKKSLKKIFCTKCKGSDFSDKDDLRKHFKTPWHNFNVKLSGQGKESFTMEDFDEYALMHPEVLN